MSTPFRRPITQVRADLEAFRNLLKLPVTTERFEFAGSVRRQRQDIGDVDVVAIPRFAMIDDPENLFGQQIRANLLWARVDDLVKLGTFSHYIKETTAGPRPKWGDICRAIAFNGICYEVTICDTDNWFMRLAIATGPALISKAIVTQIQQGSNYRFDGQFHVEFRDGVHPPQPVPIRDEETVFRLARLPFKPPHQR